METTKPSYGTGDRMAMEMERLYELIPNPINPETGEPYYNNDQRLAAVGAALPEGAPGKKEIEKAVEAWNKFAKDPFGVEIDDLNMVTIEALKAYLGED